MAQKWDLILLQMRVLLFLQVLAVLGVYDPANPPDTENLDPAEANPEMNITCLGAHSYLQEEDFYPGEYNGESMQKLCAKQQYGGGIGPNLYNFGAFCADGDVVFEHFAYTGQLVANTLRAKLECRTRCFCNYRLEQPNHQPKGYPGSRKSYATNPRSVQTSIIMESVGNPSWRLSYAAVSTHLYDGNQVQLQHPQSTKYQRTRLGITPENLILCGGSLPTFSLPDPYLVSDFRSNLDLCAVQLSGGNP